MDNAKEFLAEEVLVKKQLVTYRYLSRASKLHVNAAKKALFDFHKSQNAKKQGSVHATYAIYGRKLADESSHHHTGHDGDADVDMDSQSVDDEELFAEHVPTFYLTLVAEEHLEAALSKYDSIESIHVYSLSSQPATDLQILADSTRQLREFRTASGQEESPKTFGTIPNSHVRRRQRKGHAPGPAPKAAPKPIEPPSANSVWNKLPKSSAPHDAPGPNSIWNKIAKRNEAASESAASSGTDTRKSAAPPSLKKSGSSSGGGGIMQAFAKGAAAAKPKKKQSLQPAKPSPAAQEDTAMGLSEDEGDDDTDLIPKAQQVTGGKSRKEREAELRKMMEDDDDDDGEEADHEDEDEKEDTPMEDADEPPAEPVAAAPEPAKAEEPAEVVSASKGDGRRRGKRRVMKKKMIEDENGYLVTIQEQVWESFSEDEAPAKPSHAAAPAATSQAKPKKAAPKTGQGNIMSFFSKK